MNRTLLCPLLVLALLPAACGSDDESSASDPAATPEPPHAEFVSEGNRLCKMFVAEIGDLSSKMLGDGRPTPKKASAFAAAAVPITERSMQEIAAIPAPAEDKPKIDAMLSAFSDGIEAFRRAGESPKVAEQLLQSEDPFAKANASARELGLTECDS